MSFSFRQAKSYVDSFVNFERTPFKKALTSFHLSRMRHLLRCLGDPQKGLKIIHVAGTKGKGSTCSFIAHMLKKSGRRVGLYTSPHLWDFRERIRILSDKEGRPLKGNLFEDAVSPSAFAALVKKYKPYIEKVRRQKRLGALTYFEVLTALALCYFRQEKVDGVVLETGLGGRFDATNVTEAQVSVLTSVGLDHTQWLGKTLAAIAKEKAAIIKGKGQDVVLAPQAPEAQHVIERVCRRKHVRALWIGRDVKAKIVRRDKYGQQLVIQTPKNSYRLFTRLLGRHQAINAAVAIGVIETLKGQGWDIPERAVMRGAAETFWPGRFEIIARRPYVVLDGAHNPGSCQKLVATLRDIFPSRKVILIYGVSQDKDRETMARILAPAVDEVILTRAAHPRAHPFTLKEGEELFHPRDVTCATDVRRAVKMALTKAKKNDVVLIAGSLFVVGQVRKEFYVTAV